MRVIFAALLSVGLIGVGNREANASWEAPVPSLDASLLSTPTVKSAAKSNPLQLVRHHGHRRGRYHHRGGHFRHHQRRYGAYYGGGYGPACYRPVPIAPYRGSGFGLYIGF